MNIPYDSTEIDTILSALANQKRRGIVHNLSLNPATISQLANNHDLTLPAIHKHIRILESARLIVRNKVGRTNFISLNAGTLAIARNWFGQYNTAWSSTDTTFENYTFE